MASTNKTSNYELSQFLGTDKPAWLSDYNTDMSKIDTQMKANADAASGADGKADANATAIGTLANLTTDVKTSLVAAVNEVDGHADTAQNTANGASTTANAAKTKADDLETFLTLSEKGSITVSLDGASVGNINSLYYALNENGTYGKIYGRYRFTKTTAGTATLTLPIAKLATIPTAFSIEGAGYYTANVSGQLSYINAFAMTVNTNKTVTIEFGSGIPQNAVVTIWLPPCIYYITDFGDQPAE